jgi:ABC-type dipeptide/oligopeptide/nickel transport system ATPase subunit
MSLIIKISDVKNLASLEFPVPAPGVFVLTGENGSGKTTVLACLVRIGQADSFPRHFKTSLFSSKLDQFTGAQVTYDISTPGLTVTYTYSGSRWDPTPKKNGASLLVNSGYSEVIYVAADDGRVTPRKEDFRTKRIKDASQFIKSHANTVFSTSKFNNLRTVNVRKGVGQQAYVFEVSIDKFVSEKNFSLGELVILKLLRKLENAKNSALIVIDELEIALHPLAQERLLYVLRDIANQKQLTIIFSTHSATLIRAVKPSQLIFLERIGSAVNCISNCYPTYALGRIAPASDLSADVVLLVEDIHAQTFLRALLKKAASAVFTGGSMPTIAVTPIGSWHAVLRFFARSQSVFSTVTRVGVVLDADCHPILNPAVPAGLAAGQPLPVGGVPQDIQQIYSRPQIQAHFRLRPLNLQTTRW